MQHGVPFFLLVEVSGGVNNHAGPRRTGAFDRNFFQFFGRKIGRLIHNLNNGSLTEFVG